MHYIIYKTTNKINGKFYIGKHQTNDIDDGYMGSGKLLKRAIKKHGIENFVKEILHVFDNEADMNAKEKELVVISEQSYNLCDGGNGGFGYINKNPELVAKRDNVAYKRLGRQATNSVLESKYGSNWRSHLSKLANKRKQEMIANGELVPSGWSRRGAAGKPHSEETKQKISASKRGRTLGSNNSQYGTCWITDGSNNKKINPTYNSIPSGWYKGRV